MSLICEFDLDIVKMYPCTKNEVSRPRLSKVRAQTGQADTHRQTDVNKRIISCISEW